MAVVATAGYKAFLKRSRSAYTKPNMTLSKL